MKIYPFYIVLTVIFLFGIPVNAPGAQIVTEEAVYYQNAKNVSGYLARPADKQKHPGLILIHEWWGLNDNIRENARKFAELGNLPNWDMWLWLLIFMRVNRQPHPMRPANWLPALEIMSKAHLKI
jgi:hypothetical protein